MSRKYLIDEDELINILFEMIKIDVEKENDKSLLKRYINERKWIESKNRPILSLDILNDLETKIEVNFLTDFKDKIQDKLKKYIFQIRLGDIFYYE